MYQTLEELEKILKHAHLFKKIYVGSHFELNKNTLPLCVIKAGEASIEHLVIGKMETHIIGLLHENTGLEKKKLALMKKTMQVLNNFYKYPLEDPRIFFDADAFAVFGLSVPVTAPYGAFRLTYTLDFRLELET